MSRTYTTRTILDGGQVKEEDFNSEVQGALQEFNGQLDGHQLPLNSITEVQLKQPTTSTNWSSLDGTYSSYMVSQGYHQSEFTQGQTVVKMDYNNQLYAGFSWIKLQALETQLGAAVGGAQITFNALEGMLAGCAVIDFNWFSGEAKVTNDVGTNYFLYGSGQVIEWGVFVDNVLVSKSGYIWPRRMTLNLPYSTPISSKPVTVDIRFRVQFLDPASVATYSEYGSITIEALQSMTYKGGCLWARNEYR